MDLPFDAFLRATYAWLIEGADKEGIDRFNAILFRPPPSASAEEIAALPEWSDEAMGAQFMAQMAARGTRG